MWEIETQKLELEVEGHLSVQGEWKLLLFGFSSWISSIVFIIIFKKIPERFQMHTGILKANSAASSLVEHHTLDATSTTKTKKISKKIIGQKNPIRDLRIQRKLN